jgi:hypothetical protein
MFVEEIYPAEVEKLLTVLEVPSDQIKNTLVKFNDITPTVSHDWGGPVEFATYTNLEIEAYSCVAGDVACNTAPAVPSTADAWSGQINNA